MDINHHINSLLAEIGPGKMMSTAYDTAWLARLVEIGDPIGADALYWLRENQHSDGSWGVGEFVYAHDRLICTLAAMTALAKMRDDRDYYRLSRALLGMDTAIRGLRSDAVGETVGFEMIAPTMMEEAKLLGVTRRRETGRLVSLLYPDRYDQIMIVPDDIPHRRQSDVLEQLGHRRVAKMERLPKGKINRFVTVAFSAEMVGTDGVQLLDIPNLIEPNGSVGHSPSATVHYLLNVSPNDQAALTYLRDVVSGNGDGGSPDVAPFDVFERSWTLWNLSLGGLLDDETLSLCKPHLDFLEDSWNPGVGVGFAAEYTPKDGDDTGLVFETLARYGRKMDIEALMRYEKEDHFQCYQLESNPSVSANIHLLGALRYAGYDRTNPAVDKIIDFLIHTRFLHMFWFDKWHSSPYYPTTHLVIAAEGLADYLVESSVEWILDSQNKNGSWGYYIPTAEETAYCLQALITWYKGGKSIPLDPIKRGLDWLADHMDPPYPPLWIGKSLYLPILVVRSSILSALNLGSQL